MNNSGKRYTKKSGLAFLKNKLQKRDRKDTLVLRPCHIDLQPALDALLYNSDFNAIATELAYSITLVSNSVDCHAVVGDDDDDVEETGATIVDE